MFQVALKQKDAPRRILSEDEFIREIAALEAAGFAGVVAGPVSVEALDTEGRVCWRAYFTSVERLAELAHQLVEERALRSPSPVPYRR